MEGISPRRTGVLGDCQDGADIEKKVLEDMILRLSRGQWGFDSGAKEMSFRVFQVSYHRNLHMLT